MNTKLASMAYKWVMSNPSMAEKFLQSMVYGKRGNKGIVVRRRRRSKRVLDK